MSLCSGGAHAAENKIAPWAVEGYRVQYAINMTLDLLPLCAHEDWDARTVAKVAEALARYQFEMLKASNDVDLKNPNYQALEQAKQRRDDLLNATLTDKQIRDISELQMLSDVIDLQDDEAGSVFIQVCSTKALVILSQAGGLAGWEVTKQDLEDVLPVLKDYPKLAHPSIQSAVSNLQDVIKRHPQKVTALAKQLTSTLKNADVGL